jgi:hypothetical protein
MVILIRKELWTEARRREILMKKLIAKSFIKENVSPFTSNRGKDIKKTFFRILIDVIFEN